MADFPDRVRTIDRSSPDLIARLLELNQLNATELSVLDERRFLALMSQSFTASEIGGGSAFLLSFDQGSDYDSPNFQWFCSKYSKFVYVDRVAVSASSRGRGLASELYSHLFDVAARAGHDLICCEVNVNPPNPASDAFHARQGFDEVGRTALSNGKTVRYLAKRL